jgi:hypothetical protein
MFNSTLRRLMTLALLLALGLAAPAAAAAGKRPQAPKAAAAPVLSPMGQILEWLDRLGLPASVKSILTGSSPEDVTEVQEITLERGAMIDPNG